MVVAGILQLISSFLQTLFTIWMFAFTYVSVCKMHSRLNGAVQYYCFGFEHQLFEYVDTQQASKYGATLGNNGERFVKV